MLVRFKADCFSGLGHAILSGDEGDLARFLPDAYKAIHKALCHGNLSKKDCEALHRALRWLDAIQTKDARKAA